MEAYIGDISNSNEDINAQGHIIDIGDSILDATNYLDNNESVATMMESMAEALCKYVKGCK